MRRKEALVREAVVYIENGKDELLGQRGND